MLEQFYYLGLSNIELDTTDRFRFGRCSLVDLEFLFWKQITVQLRFQVKFGEEHEEVFQVHWP